MSLTRGTLPKRLAKVRKDIEPLARRGLFAAAEHVLGESNDKVPLETGEFMRGGVASVADDELVAAVSYSDKAFSGQSEVLHEDLDMRHDEGRTAKFLENAITSERKTVGRIVANTIKGGLGA